MDKKTVDTLKEYEHDFVFQIKQFYLTYRLLSSLFIFVSLLVVVSAMILAFLLLYPYPSHFQSYQHFSTQANGDRSDPINMIFIGDDSQIRSSFAAAGWKIADPVTAETSARIALDALIHLSYPTAPVSPQYVQGKMQTVAFEKEHHDATQREHIRLWHTPEQFGGKDVWLAAASYDSGIELSHGNHLPTHHISPTIDTERNAIGIALHRTGFIRAEQLIQFNVPMVFARNSGGDFYETDGNVLVVSFIDLPPELNQVEQFPHPAKDNIFLLYSTLLNLFSGVNYDLGGIPLQSFSGFWSRHYIYLCSSIVFCY